MRIEVWADIVCPFCWIGRRHLQEALRRTGIQAEVVHRAFELDPQATRQPVLEHLQDKYGQRAPELARRAAAMGRAAGLDMDFDSAIRAPTFDAHRLVHLGRQEGREDAVLERLMRAHFTEGQDVGDAATLDRLGTDVGLEGVAEALAGDRFGDAVRAEQDEARRLGVSGVPFFVFDRRLALSGAQPVEVFRQALEQAQRREDAPRPLR